jgi:hypothetical protein
VPFQGPKKSRFSGPTPSNAPRDDVAPLKTITYRAIKTTGTLIVILYIFLAYVVHLLCLRDVQIRTWPSIPHNRCPVTSSRIDRWRRRCVRNRLLLLEMEKMTYHILKIG